MATKRLKDMDELERSIVHLVWQDAIKLPHDGVWHKYSNKIKYKDAWYTITCRFCYDGITFSYNDLLTIADTKTIWLDPKDFH